jgi:hypothetical protein
MLHKRRMFFLRVAHGCRIIDVQVSHPAASQTATSTASSAHQSQIGAAQSKPSATLIYKYLDRLSRTFRSDQVETNKNDALRIG